MSGELKVDGNNVTLKETDGIDYAAVTVQLPGGAKRADFVALVLFRILWYCSKICAPLGGVFVLFAHISATPSASTAACESNLYRLEQQRLTTCASWWDSGQPQQRLQFPTESPA